MSSKGGRKCPYKECYLPNNNKKYLYQFVYLLVSGLYLLVDENEFTFFAILMFTAPILLDLVSTELDGKLYRFFSGLYITINTALAVFSFAGMFGLFVDVGNAFAITEKAMLLANASCPKKFLLIPLTIDLFIPLMMYHACPSKNNRLIIECAREQRKVGSA